MILDLLDELDRIEEEVEGELGSREIQDDHDYSSSRYNAYDDGFNDGVREAAEQFRERIERVLRSKLVAGYTSGRHGV